MDNRKAYTIHTDKEVSFKNNADYCVGTGRMGLALQQEYMEQLKLVQRHIGFKYIRGHGLFADDMAIYQEYTDEKGAIVPEYNFTYLDLVMDNYRSLGLRPFLELGFMPEKLASGTQTIFYWKGNVTPPKSYAAWAALIEATLRHLIERYGRDEVLAWPIEVWNEPNLTTFWKDADMEEYFRLFETSFRAVKQVDERFRVGGPAICGVDDARWMRSFLEFCEDRGLRIDFITRHHYVSEAPQREGHYSYVKLLPLEESLDSLKSSREIVDSFENFRGKEIHITEFNTSYVPNAPVHDTNYNAAYTAYLLSKLGDMNESYSYWTFGDIFEEYGVPFTPFHGGFGLVANRCIPKPTFWTFAFFKELQGRCVHRSDDFIILKRPEGKGFAGLAWNPSKELLRIDISMKDMRADAYFFARRIVDEDDCNPLKIWHNMGEPAHLMPEQLKLLQEGALPRLLTEKIGTEKGSLAFTLELKKNALVYFELSETLLREDRGYSYERVMEQR